MGRDSVKFTLKVAFGWKNLGKIFQFHINKSINLFGFEEFVDRFNSH